MNKIHKFEVWYESYPIIKSGRLASFSREGRTLCCKVVEIESLDGYYTQLLKSLEVDGFSNFILQYRKINDDGITDKEFEEFRAKEFYDKFPLLSEALSKLKLNQ